METLIREYKGVAWNAGDLISCKQGCCILINDGATWEELSSLDFGNLDVAEVWDEEHRENLSITHYGRRVRFDYNSDTGLYHYDGDESYTGFTLNELYDMDEYEL